MTEYVLTRRVNWRDPENGDEYHGPGKFDLSDDTEERASQFDYWQKPENVGEDALRNAAADAIAQGKDPEDVSVDSNDSSVPNKKAEENSGSDENVNEERTFNRDEYIRLRNEGRNTQDGWEAVVEMLESGELDHALEQVDTIEQERDSQSQGVFDAIQERRQAQG